MNDSTRTGGGRRAGRGLVAVLVSGLVWSLAACGDGASTHPDPHAAVERVRQRRADEPVATVGGRRLGLAEFQTYWRRHPELSADEVVERVVEREIAVQRALDGGTFSHWPAVARERKKGLVRAFLERAIEQPLGAAELEQKALKAEVERLRKQLRRPAGYRASQLLVMVPEQFRGKKPEQGKPSRRRAVFESAREVVDEIAAELPDRPALAELYRARRGREPPAGLRIVVNANLRFPDPEDPAADGDLPEGWLNVVPGFARGARQLGEQKRFGELSEPVRSRYGWHLIVVHEAIPARVPKTEPLRAFARANLLRKRRSERLASNFREWRRGQTFTVYPNVIERAGAGEETSDSP